MDDDPVVERIPMPGAGELPLMRSERDAFTPQAWDAILCWLRATHASSLYQPLRGEGFAFDDMVHAFARSYARWDRDAFEGILQKVVQHKALTDPESEAKRLTALTEFGVHLLKTTRLRNNSDASLFRPTRRDTQSGE